MPREDTKACPLDEAQVYAARMGGQTKILVLFAHPAFQKSRVNRHLVGAIRGLEGVTFRDLYETYPDFQIDVPVEQGLLRRHDVTEPDANAP